MTLTKKKEKMDILHGSIRNKLPMYALPVAATGILEQLFNASDVAIVGNFASTDRTVAIAASSAAYNIEILVYYIFNSFSQACTTFVGQNYGAGQIKRCRRTLALCPIEDSLTSVATILLILMALFAYRPAHRMQQK